MPRLIRPTLAVLTLLATLLPLAPETAQAQRRGVTTFRIGGHRAPTAAHTAPRFAQRRITLDVRDQPVRRVLRLIAREGNVNIIASDDVQGRVTLAVTDVPVRHAFLSVLSSLSLTYERAGSVLVVRPITRKAAGGS